MKVKLCFLFLFSLININISFANDDVDDEDITAAFGETCKLTGPYCNADKALKCVNGKCTCNSSLLTHAENAEGCVLKAQPSNTNCEHDEQCTESVLGKDSFCLKVKFSKTGKCECREIEGDCKIHRLIGEDCRTDSECKSSVLGDVVCLGSNEAENKKGICKCANGYIFVQDSKECLKLGFINSACKSDLQCNHSETLGHLSRCTEDTKTCECWDTTGHGEKNTKFHEGMCYYSRKVNESCTDQIECILGYHEHANCWVHDSYNGAKVCQCSDGYQCDATSLAAPAAIVVLISTILYICFE